MPDNDIEARLRTLHARLAAARQFGKPNADALARELQACKAIALLSRNLTGARLTSDERVALMDLVAQTPKADETTVAA